MSGFTLTFVPEPTETGTMQDGYNWRARAAHADFEKLRAKIAKDAQYLGPWCPNCGKRGKKCRDRYACNVRVINRHKTPAIGADEQRKRYALAMGA